MFQIIVPIRNPKDQAISWYHFAQGPKFAPIREHVSPDWSQFFSDYIEGEAPARSVWESKIVIFLPYGTTALYQPVPI